MSKPCNTMACAVERFIAIAAQYLGVSADDPEYRVMAERELSNAFPCLCGGTQ